MGQIKYVYDETDLKNSNIEVNYVGSDDENILDSLKVFCLDSIPEGEIEEIEEKDDGYLVKVKKGYGEEVLAHIFRMTYLVTKFAFIFAKDIESGNFNMETADLSLLDADIKKVTEMDYKELGKLLEEEDNLVC